MFGKLLQSLETCPCAPCFPFKATRVSPTLTAQGGAVVCYLSGKQLSVLFNPSLGAAWFAGCILCFERLVFLQS